MKHGKGVWKKHKDANKHPGSYEGEYLYDKKNGFGVFKWASGNVYEGYYVDDERNGRGTMIWTDGSKYVGEWKNGI